MRKVLSVLFLLCSVGAAQADWIRRADIQGNITDIAIFRGGTTPVVYLATDGAGVYFSDNGTTWESRSNGLDDLRIAAIAVDPVDGIYAKLVTRSNKVFVTADSGLNWTADNYSGTGGLGLITTPWVPTDIAYVQDGDSGPWYTYVATKGAGVIRQNGWGGQWAQFNSTATGFINLQALCVGAVSEGSGGRYKVLVGTATTLYSLSVDNGLWSPVTGGLPGDVSFLSIAYHQIGFALVGLSRHMSSTLPAGVWYSTGNTSWLQLCDTPADEDYLAVDYRQDGTGFDVVAGAAGGLYRIDDATSTTCTAGGYHLYPQFRGSIRAVAVAETAVGALGWAGGPGKGPVFFDPNGYAGPVANIRGGIEDNNVVGLTLSPNYPADSTLFAASGVAGMYKNTSLFSFSMTNCNANTFWPGYFYRMIGDPDSWGIVPVKAVRTVPAYDNTLGYPFRTLFAASPGRGVLRSDDGGRSWVYVNGDGDLLAGAEITDLFVHPDFDGMTNRTLYAAVYGKGVYRSLDAGGSWALLASASLGNTRVICLGFGKDFVSTGYLFAGCRSTSGQVGLWEYTGSAWTSKAGTLGMSVSAIGTRDDFYDFPWIFIGTEAHGAHRSTDHGATFTAINSGLPASARIYDLKVSPGFGTAQRLLAAVKPTTTTDGGVYTAKGSTFVWTQITAGLTDRRITSVAFNPDFTTAGEIFCGHAFKGVYIANLGSTGLQCDWRQGAGFYNVPPAIESLAVSPEDSRTVFAASSMDGVFVSRDGGDTFRPWGAFENGTGGPAIPETISVAVTGSIFLNESFHGGVLPAGWTTVNGGSTGGLTWSTANPAKTGCLTRGSGSLVSPSMLIDSQCDGAAATQNDKLVTPAVDTSGAQTLRLFFYDFYDLTGDSDFAYVKVCSSATGGSCDPATGTSWTTVQTTSAGTGNLPDRALTLTAYKGTGFRVMFHYVGANDKYWAVDDVRLVDTGAAALGRPNVVVGTRGSGVYYSGYDEGTHFGTFTPSDLTAGRIREIRYTAMGEDLRAADATGGDWHSRDFGRTWTLISNFGGANIADMSYGSGLTLAADAERGLSAFIWGASSGKSLGSTLRAEACNNLGRAWYRSGGYSTAWTACAATGLNVCEDFRSILQLASTGHKDVLMGSLGIGSGAADPEWKGLYRAPSDCSAWTASNEGLPCTASGDDCINTAQVWALWQNPSSTDRFILASVTDSDDSDANGDQGGVYYSDWWSYGKAWAKTTLPAPDPGSVDLASSTGGTAIYTGLADDGVFSSVPSTITVQNVTAYFEAPAEACVNASVTFSDYSAGQTTEYAWDFGDGASCHGPTANTCAPNAYAPAHVFTTAGVYTVAEGVENALALTDSFEREIAIRGELDLGNTLRVTHSGTSAVLTWTDLNLGETGYQVWASTSASAGSPYGLLLGPSVTTYTYAPAVPNMTCEFFRVQPKSTSYICGDGIVGGSW